MEHIGDFIKTKYERAKYQSDILARDIEAEMQKIIRGYNLNLKRI
jgi:hypothetical protein